MLIRKVDQRIQQYLGFLERKKYDRVLDLRFELAETLEAYRNVPEDLEWEPIDLPYGYGREWGSSWFRTEIVVPDGAAGRQLFLRALPHSDSLVFLDGDPIGAVNTHHERIRLATNAKPGESHTVHIESYGGHIYPGCNPFDRDVVFTTNTMEFPGYPIPFSDAALEAKNEAVYELYYDVRTLFELAQQLDEHSLRKNRILQGLYANLMRIDYHADDELLSYQIATVSHGIKPLLECRNGSTVPTVYAVGHAHIDHAWLWPIAETEKKIARTFANMCRYAAEFEDFVFVQSQPCQLDFLAREYPSVFENVKATYERGQWEPNGGMWVEADCNVTGGESLVRQFLVGKATTTQLLGYEGDTLWLPDVFGYSAALPQIMRRCGIRYFVTSKINWNDTTRFPYDTFRWRGIDGSGVETTYIMDCGGGYNGSLQPENIFESWINVQHKEIQDGIIKPIGEGDGGGGTHRSDLEFAKRLADLEGCPRVEWVKVSDAAQRVFAGIEDLPEWRGELYLELHRGTYTTQARTKRYNRKLEIALRESEALRAMTMPSLLGILFPGAAGKGVPYPAEELLSCWKTVLTNQFHDIIPGSSIQRVYEVAEKEYAQVGDQLQGIKRDGLDVLDSCLGRGDGLSVYNMLSWNRASKAVVPDGLDVNVDSVVTAGNSTFAVQEDPRVDGATPYVFFPEVPSMGGRSFEIRAGSAAASPFDYTGDTLHTPFWAVTFDEAGRISSQKNRGGWKEYVKDGAALNTLVSAEDVPMAWDAWDIDEDYNLKISVEDRLLSREVVADGPLFIKIRSTYNIGKRSELVQDAVFYSGDPRIDFETRVDWNEEHRLLKAAFPTNLQAHRVKCEIQYGHVERNIHGNSMADRAQFEVCAHKWAGLNDGNHGLAVLNDCKYGHDAKDGTIRLTLLKAPKAPDPTADLGTHYFTYAILPYEGPFSCQTVVRSAYDLNHPLSVSSAAGPSDGFSLFEIDNPSVIAESVKKAEADDSLVLRLYDASGGEQPVRLTLAAPIAQAEETDMLERQGTSLDPDGATLELRFGPFEIKTLKIRLVTEVST